ncbi:hypothetical protein AT05_07330 [Schleiferia thermophila str. Yellowstone]|nr:hypothetical protein AT05_07330 [Schleiferia thermophila str. Yellowstone]
MGKYRNPWPNKSHQRAKNFVINQLQTVYIIHDPFTKYLCPKAFIRCILTLFRAVFVASCYIYFLFALFLRLQADICMAISSLNEA